MFNYGQPVKIIDHDNKKLIGVTGTIYSVRSENHIEVLFDKEVIIVVKENQIELR